MTATDKLRRLLDERGVEWIGTSFSTPAKGHPTNTSLGEEHHEATFIEYDDGNVLRLFDLTPAQAVDATLGSGESAKLRELVRHMHTCLEHYEPGDTISCEQCPYDNETWGCDYERLMAELGIEVDV